MRTRFDDPVAVVGSISLDKRFLRGGSRLIGESESLPFIVYQ
jgi:hypothetical protein